MKQTLITLLIIIPVLLFSQAQKETFESYIQLVESSSEAKIYFTIMTITITDVDNGYDLKRVTNQFTSKEVALETLQELVELKKNKNFWVNLSGTFIIQEEYEI